MTSSFDIPDGISFGELQNLADAAAEREDAMPAKTDSKNDFQSQCNHAAEKALELALELCEDPMVHKIMALRIMSNMIDWHTKMGTMQFEDNNSDSGVCWLRDAGKFQSIINILLDVECGPNDFTVKE